MSYRSPFGHDCDIELIDLTGEVEENETYSESSARVIIPVDIFVDQRSSPPNNGGGLSKSTSLDGIDEQGTQSHDSPREIRIPTSNNLRVVINQWTSQNDTSIRTPTSENLRVVNHSKPLMDLTAQITGAEEVSN